MNPFALLIMSLMAAGTFGQEQPKRIGEIEFFGYTGIDLDRIRLALPFHEGEPFNLETGEEKIGRAREAVRQVTGRPPTDVATTCCDDRGNWILYLGLSGRPISYNPQPTGAARLPEGIIRLYERFIDATAQADQKDVAAEDRRKGYALSEDPQLRATQLEMRAYAVDHEGLLRKVLARCEDDRQRYVAAEVIAYAHQSKSQLVALAHASRDRNSTVRNNATRALMVLAESNSKIAAQIPPASFVPHPSLIFAHHAGLFETEALG